MPIFSLHRVVKRCFRTVLFFTLALKLVYASFKVVGKRVLEK